MASKDSGLTVQPTGSKLTIQEAERSKKWAHLRKSVPKCVPKIRKPLIIRGFCGAEGTAKGENI